MKKLFEFKIKKKELVEESETTENEDGQKVTTTKDVKKEVEKLKFLRKPTRKLFDDAELFYGVELSKGIKAGLLTRALLQKRFSNDGGVLGEKEREEWGNLYSEIFDKQVELQRLTIIENRTPEQEEEFEGAKEFLKDSRTRVQEFEMQQSSLYDQTAENRARNRTILWWVLHLAHSVEDEGVEAPFFGAGSYEDKINEYDRMEEEEDEFATECINKFFYYVSFWYVSKTSDPKQFKDLIKFAEQQDLEETDADQEEAAEEVVEEIKSEEAPAEETPSEVKDAEEADPFEDVTEETPSGGD